MAQVLLEIQTNHGPNLAERRFPSDMKIVDLKSRLELITGASGATMQLTFRDTSGNEIGQGEDSKCIGDYLIPGGELRLRLDVLDSQAVKYDDLFSVPKYEMSEEEYSKRDKSLRAFKMRNQLGRFSEGANAGDQDDEGSIAHIKVGARCEVTATNAPPRRGQVMYVGKVGSLKGLFVGVRYDEPFGKNNGSFEGVPYFECPPNYGSFVRPNLVQVGDYPELEVNFDD